MAATSLLTWRSIGEADLPAVQRVAAASDLADDTPYTMTVEEIGEIVEGSNPGTGRFLVEDDGQAVAWGVVGWDPPDEPRERDRIVLWGGIVPSHRRRGIGTELLARQLAAAERIAAGQSWPTDARLYANVPDDGREALAARYGLAQARWFEDLKRDLAPLDRATPDGIVVTAWLPEHDEPARRLKNAAFADHWGSSSASADAWRTTVEGFGVRRDLSLVALDDAGALVGLLLAMRFPDDAAMVGYDAGWIDLLAVDRSQRGRGLGSALIAASIDGFRAAGLDTAKIGVDAASETGANRLYRDLGFVSDRQSTVFLRQLT